MYPLNGTSYTQPTASPLGKTWNSFTGNFKLFRPPAAANWDFLYAAPISGPAGGAQVVFTGLLNWRRYKTPRVESKASQICRIILTTVFSVGVVTVVVIMALAVAD